MDWQGSWGTKSDITMQQTCWSDGATGLALHMGRGFLVRQGRDLYSEVDKAISYSGRMAKLVSRPVWLVIWSPESGRPMPCWVLWDWVTVGSVDEHYLRLGFIVGCHCSRDLVCQGLTMITVSPTLLFHCSLVPSVQVLQSETQWASWEATHNGRGAGCPPWALSCHPRCCSRGPLRGVLHQLWGKGNGVSVASHLSHVVCQGPCGAGECFKILILGSCPWIVV